MNRYLKYILLLLLSGVSRNVTANVQIFSEPLEYARASESYFNEILSLITVESRKKYWENKMDSMRIVQSNIMTELDQIENLFVKNGNESKFVFKYINSINDFRLPFVTDITNGIGREVFNTEFMPKLDSIKLIVERKLDEYANTPNADKFFKDYQEFRQLEKRIITLKSNFPVLHEINYQPKELPQFDPYKNESFKVMDWINVFELSKDLFIRFNSIEENITTKEYLVVKDENPVITLLFQLVTLLVLIIGLLKNYGFEVKNGIIAILILSSLIVSIGLMFFSDNTLFNIVLNIFIPCVIYFWYYLRNKPNGEEPII